MGFDNDPWLITTKMVVFYKIFILLSITVRSQEKFDDNYGVTWGFDRVLISNDRRDVQLSLDRSSGCGFASKMYYGSGLFEMKIKVPGNDSAGVVTAYFLSADKGIHNELDFEFLGNRPKQPIILQTNVFVNGVGNREQRIGLWFDPSERFHDYKILWNQFQIVFFVDDLPVRVFKNKHDGVGYPRGAMQVDVSLWDGSQWATNGGLTKTNWAEAPFQAHFQRFKVNGCPSSPNNDCYSSKYLWNSREYQQLSPKQQKDYDEIRQRYMTYDYCNDKNRHPATPPECIG